MKIKQILTGAVAALAMAGAASAASAVNLSPSNQGGKEVIANIGGQLAGLFSITGATVGDQLTLADVQAEQLSGFAITGIFAGDPTTIPPAGFQSGGIVLPGTATVPNLFDDLSGTGVEVSALSSGSGSVFDALFIQFDVVFGTTGTIAVFEGTSTFSVDDSVDLTAVVPVPAALPLMASALGALGFVGWRRQKKAA